MTAGRALVGKTSRDNATKDGRALRLIDRLSFRHPKRKREGKHRGETLQAGTFQRLFDAGTRDDPLKFRRRKTAQVELGLDGNAWRARLGRTPASDEL